MRAEAAISCNCNAFALRVFDETFLGKVWVMFNLQGRWGDFGVAKKIHDELRIKVANTD